MSPDDFRRLVSAGLTTDQIALVMEMMERDAAATAAAEEARKSKARDRVQRWRDRNVTRTSPKVTERLVTPVEVKTSSSVIEPQKKDISPQAELASVLTSERAEAVVAHRKRIGKPMTTHAAKLLGAKFAKCPDPNAAADAMVSNGWQGFEPEWMDRNQPRGSPPQKKTNLAEFIRDRTINSESPQHGDDSRLAPTSLRLIPSLGRG
jgi:hypothetical protein